MADIYLGVGSNVGDRLGNILMALDDLKSHDVRIVKCSTIIETEPVGGPPQSKYLNAVVHIQTDLNPFKLLDLLQSIEFSLGRIRTGKNSPRTIDLDILLYNQEQIHTPELTIPHPRMFERDFVMKPLREIAPELTQMQSHAHH